MYRKEIKSKSNNYKMLTVKVGEKLCYKKLKHKIKKWEITLPEHCNAVYNCYVYVSIKLYIGPLHLCNMIVYKMEQFQYNCKNRNWPSWLCHSFVFCAYHSFCICNFNSPMSAANSCCHPLDQSSPNPVECGWGCGPHRAGVSTVWALSPQ